MKPLLLIAAIFMFGCQKVKSKHSNRSFVGRWELIQYAGFGIPNNPLPRGNGNIIELNEDGVYRRFEDGEKKFEGTYSIRQHTACSYTGSFFKTNETSIDLESIISLQTDTLSIFSSPCLMDGGGGLYRRL